MSLDYPPDYCPCGGSTTTGCEPDTFCWCHFVHEPAPEPVYRVCFECNHVYLTARDLVDAYVSAVVEMDPEGVPLIRPAEDISFCQFCLHDF